MKLTLLKSSARWLCPSASFSSIRAVSRSKLKQSTRSSSLMISQRKTFSADMVSVLEQGIAESIGQKTWQSAVLNKHRFNCTSAQLLDFSTTPFSREKLDFGWLLDYETLTMKRIKLIAGNASPELAKQIAQYMGLELCSCSISRFADGEVQIEINESVRGKHVFVIQSTCPPVNENYMELFMILDALKRASANHITAVIPYYGYGRQDRKVAPRAPISAKCVADLLSTAGAERVVAIDLHAGQIQGFFNVPVDHLFVFPTLAKAFTEKYGQGSELAVVSPDAGGVERARFFAKRIGSTLAIIDKRRSGPNVAKAINLVGDVRDKIAVVVDDMIDTAGTLTQSVDSLLKNGAKKVVAVAAHPVLSDPACSRLRESALEEIWVTDTIPLSEEAKGLGKIRVVTIAPVIAEAIRRIFNKDSISVLFD